MLLKRIKSQEQRTKTKGTMDEAQADHAIAGQTHTPVAHGQWNCRQAGREP